MPGVLTFIAKLMPLTHALALMRYGFIDPSGKGLHEIWGLSSVDHRGVAQPRGGGAVRDGPDRDLDPGLRAVGSQVTTPDLPAPRRKALGPTP